MTFDLGLPYSGAVLSSRASILGLRDALLRSMPERDISLEPHFFLASMPPEWIPRVVAVNRGQDTVGAVYAKERCVAGIPTGIVFVDGRLGDAVIADADTREEVLLCGLQTLGASRAVRALRLMIPPHGPEARAVNRSRASLPADLTFHSTSPFELHASLALPTDFEAFLRSLGYRTRRNFRHYRRRFEAGRHRYIEDVPVPKLVRAMTNLQNKSRIPCGTASIARALKMIEAADRPWVVGLKGRDGDWMSISAGWFRGGRAIMLLQLNNDLEYGDASLSVVLRAYLIEALIRKHVGELIFWSGTAPPLSRYAVPLPVVRVHIDARTLGWRLLRFAVGKVEPWLPDRIGLDIRWITNSLDSALSHPAGPDEVENSPVAAWRATDRRSD